MPHGTGGRGPPGFGGERALAKSDGARRGREARAGAEDHDHRVPLGERVHEEGLSFAPNEDRPRGTEGTEAARRVAEHDREMRGGDLQIEGIGGACVIYTFPFFVHQRGGDGAGDAGEEVVEDRRERALVGVARRRGRRAHGRATETVCISESAAVEISTG